MTKLAELELILPFLKALELKGGRAEMRDVKEFIKKSFPLSKEDTKASETRKGEQLWEQQVRNLIAHKTLETNSYIKIISKGHYEIIEEGRGYLKENEETLDTLLNTGFKRDDILQELRDPKHILQEISFIEGRKELKQTAIYIRSTKLRQLAINKFSLSNGKLPCRVCNFIFEDKYKDIGKGFIEIHHIKPVRDIYWKIERVFDEAIKNLCPLCANCHRMVHRKNPCYTTEELVRTLG